MFSSLIDQRERVPTPLHPRDPAFAEFFGSSTHSAAGQTVDVSRSLGVTAAFACIRNTAETMAALPCELKKVSIDDKGRRRFEDASRHPLYRVLLREPNDWQTAYDYWRLFFCHLELRGNHYSLIERNFAGQVVALHPVHPDRIRPFWAPNRRPAYQYQSVDGESHVLLGGELLHARSFSHGDGLLGLNPIQIHRETLGMSLASRDYGARLFANDARPRAVLYTDQELDDPAFDRLKQDWRNAYAGQNRQSVAILEKGLKYEALSMTNEDAQYLETRGFTDIEVARIFRTPPFKIGILERSTLQNVEQQSRAWVIDKLAPLAACVEAAIWKTLLTANGKRNLEAQFQMQSLLRGDTKVRTEANFKGVQGGWLSVNDVREREGMNGIGPQGDVYQSPLNMAPIPQEEPEEPEEPEQEPEEEENE